MGFWAYRWYTLKYARTMPSFEITFAHARVYSVDAEEARAQLDASDKQPSSMQSCAHAFKQCTRSLTLPSAASITKWSLRRWGLPAQLRRYASVSAAELLFGQPLHETHPHLLKAGERKLMRHSHLKDR